MKRLRAHTLLAFAALVGACASDRAGTGSYLTDASFRRAALEASLVNKDNGYSRLRLAHYATGASGDWDALPVFNPRADIISPDALDAPLGANATPIDISAQASAGAEDALRSLGEEAFFRYPVQLAPAVATALKSKTAASAYGLWMDPARGTGGIVRVALADGTQQLAYTCSTCHVGVRDGSLVIGVGNDALDVGAMMVDGSAGGIGGARAKSLLAWGPGRLDVTTMDGGEPVRIPDLRPVRFLSFLHATASVAQDTATVTALAVRLETLVITSNSAVLRPPREIALGLATYLFSLGNTLPIRVNYTDSEARGKAAFDAKCASCHAPPTFQGAPVALATIGTDPHLGQSAERGTGTYRVPSLRGVGTRGPLLHDASATSLEMLFDPARTGSNFIGRIGASIPGHTFGLDLDAPARADLIAYLKTL